MSKVLVTDTYLSNIANSIRSKNGETTAYKPSEMSTAIDNLNASSTITGVIYREINEDGFVTKATTSNLTIISSGFFRTVSSSIGCYKNLQEIIFDSSLQSIETNAFRGNDSLTTVIFQGTPTSMASNVFYNNTTVLNIYVPWGEGELDNAPWGCSNATIHYNQ